MQTFRFDFALLVLATGLTVATVPSRVEDRVVRVVDGDTVVLSSIGRARLIGVDSPESVKPDSPRERFGPEAARFTRKWLEGRQVWVERGDEPTDRHGRALVYLFLEDGRLFNRLLIEEGFAYAYTLFPCSRRFEFLAAEDGARLQGKGLWKRLSPVQRALPLHGNTRSRSYHREGCEYYECPNCTRILEGRVEAERLGFEPHWACIGSR